MRILLLFLINVLFGIAVMAQPKARCYEQAAPFHDPQLAMDLEAYTAQWIRERPSNSRSKITIPVVVHVVWNSEEDNNISDEQIHSQIDALNRDFQLQNENLTIVPDEFTNIIGNVGFEFCLTSIDPEGNPTTGITRTETRFTNVGTRGDSRIYYTERGGKDAWDTERYLNIWVAEVPDILGYASRPGENIAAEDGVVVHTDCFGTIGTVQPPNDLGRTATHEIGHYFNLLHLSGDIASCEEDDMVMDTPQQMTNYFGCPDIYTFSCGSQDLIANYMNWVDDACMALFTQGQADRMYAALIGARAGLLENTACLTTSIPLSLKSKLSIYPNPAVDHIYVKSTSDQVKELRYQILDTKGRLIKEGIFQNNTKLNRISLPFPKGVYFIKSIIEQEVSVKALLLF